jgi:hypothetical protein
MEDVTVDETVVDVENVRVTVGEDDSVPVTDDVRVGLVE